MYPRQIALADRIVINKMDLVDAPTLDQVEASIRSINANALINRTSRSKVDLNFLLDIDAYAPSSRQLNPVFTSGATSSKSGHIDEVC